MLITTTDTLQGMEIGEYLGLVYGISQDVVGGIGKMGHSMMEKTMEPLKQSIQAAGEQVGADAVIGLRVEFDKGYVRAVGTAVKFK